MSKITLEMGVIDFPYQDVEPAASKASASTMKGKPKNRAPKAASGAPVTKTTGDVAGWLEAHYGIFGLYFGLRGGDVLDKLATGISDQAIRESITGIAAPFKIDPRIAESLATGMKQFISARGFDGLAPNTPTQAAKDGINSRMKSRRTPGRPSFRDTGQFQSAIAAAISVED